MEVNMDYTLRRSIPSCRHPVLYLPISGIPDPNNDTNLFYQKQLWEVSLREDFEQAQTQTKA